MHTPFPVQEEPENNPTRGGKSKRLRTGNRACGADTGAEKGAMRHMNAVKIPETQNRPLRRRDGAGRAILQGKKYRVRAFHSVSFLPRRYVRGDIR